METFKVCLYEHNYFAYVNLQKQLERFRKTCIIHPTGTGKSFIVFRFAEENYDKSFLWITPSIMIFNNQIENVEKICGFTASNIHAITYSKIIHMTDEELISISADYICIDEFHRAGANKWSKGVQKLIDLHPDSMVIGLSATPIRYLDGNRNMAIELFDGHIASEMTLGEAIMKGILSSPKYIITTYSIYKIAKEYITRAHKRKEQIDIIEKKMAELKKMLENSTGLDTIFQKYMLNKHGKYLVFCSNVNHLRTMVNKVPEWFGKIDSAPHVYTIWAKSMTAKMDFNSFKIDNSSHLKLLFCIDMFNEGIHIDDIDGIIMFRPTVSPVIYKQQIGRALTVSGKKKTIIIDVVNNYEGLNSVLEIQQEFRRIVSYYRNSRREDQIIVNQFEIIDEARECRDVIKELESELTISWERMYQVAREYYFTNGNLDVPSNYKTENNESLGQWLYLQRCIKKGKVKGVLSDQQIKLLNDIGMCWSSKNDSSWQKGFEHAIQYKERNGNLNVPNAFTCEDGYKLGEWIIRQRHNWRRLLETGNDPLLSSRFRALNDIGITWDLDDSFFNKAYDYAKKYYNLYGHLDIPARFVTEDGFKLGIWITTMRKRYNLKAGLSPLPQRYIDLLEQLSIKWEGVTSNKWQKYFDEFRNYVNTSGKTEIPINYVQNGINIGAWIKGQRKLYFKGRMKNDRIKQFIDIGVDWKRNNSSWNNYYEAAKAYFTKYHNLQVPASYVTNDGIWLSKWLQRQRKAYKSMKLTQYQIDLLEEIGMRWSSYNEERWLINYQEAILYPQSKDGFPVVPKGIVSSIGVNLRRWVEEQKRKYKKGTLDNEAYEYWKLYLLPYRVE